MFLLPPGELRLVIWWINKGINDKYPSLALELDNASRPLALDVRCLVVKHYSPTIANEFDYAN